MSDNKALNVGDQVEDINEPSSWENWGKVVKVNDSGTYDIEHKDGNVYKGVPLSRVRQLKSSLEENIISDFKMEAKLNKVSDLEKFKKHILDTMGKEWTDAEAIKQFKATKDLYGIAALFNDWHYMNEESWNKLLKDYIEKHSALDRHSNDNRCGTCGEVHQEGKYYNHNFVKRKTENIKLEDKKSSETAWSKVNHLAEEMFGEFGIVSLDEDNLAKIINLNKADKLAENLFGEFGFSTLSENNMKKLINAYPEIIKKASLDKKSDEQESKIRPVEYKELKIRPREVEEESVRSAELPTDAILNAYKKLKTHQNNLAEIGKLIAEVKTKFNDEVRKIETDGKKIEDEQGMRQQIDDLVSLIKTSQSRVVSFGSKLVAFVEEEQTRPFKLTDKEKLEKVLDKFPDVEKYLDRLEASLKKFDTKEKVQKLIEWELKENAVKPAPKAELSLSKLDKTAGFLDVIKSIYDAASEFFTSITGLNEELDRILPAQEATASLRKSALNIDDKVYVTPTGMLNKYKGIITKIDNSNRTVQVFVEKTKDMMESNNWYDFSEITPIKIASVICSECDSAMDVDDDRQEWTSYVCPNCGHEAKVNKTDIKADLKNEENIIEELRDAGCKCPKPLLGYRPNIGPRCRLCGTIVKDASIKTDIKARLKMHAFDQNTENWISDRIENEEPLMWSEFIKFMKELGSNDKTLDKYKSTEYKEKVLNEYNKYKKQRKYFPISYNKDASLNKNADPIKTETDPIPMINTKPLLDEAVEMLNNTIDMQKIKEAFLKKKALKKESKYYTAKQTIRDFITDMQQNGDDEALNDYLMIEKIIPEDYITIDSESSTDEESELYNMIYSLVGDRFAKGKKLFESESGIDCYEFDYNGIKIYLEGDMTDAYYIPKDLFERLKKELKKQDD